MVFDCSHPASLARFWAAALDGHRVAPYDEAELARLRSLGVDHPEDDPSVLVEPAAGGEPRLWFTRVPEPKAGKNRVHLGLCAADVAAEVVRLVGLGARILAELDDRVGLADPEGDEFCVQPARPWPGTSAARPATISRISAVSSSAYRSSTAARSSRSAWLEYPASSATSRSSRPRPSDRTVTEIEIRADTRIRSETNDARDARLNRAMPHCAPSHTLGQAVPRPGGRSRARRGDRAADGCRHRTPAPAQLPAVLPAAAGRTAR